MSLSREQIERAVTGALQSTVDAHGREVAGSWIGSATKRITSQLAALSALDGGWIADLRKRIEDIPMTTVAEYGSNRWQCVALYRKLVLQLLDEQPLPPAPAGRKD